MKNIFEKELAIFNIIKSIRVKDLNLVSALLAFIIVFIHLLTDKINMLPRFNTEYILLSLILLIGIVIISKSVNKQTIQSFVCIQIFLLFINLLLISLFPLSLVWFRVLISLYFIFNCLLFIIFSQKD